MRLSNFHFTFYISWHVAIVREDGSHFPHDTYKLLHFENFNSKFQQILFLT
nr:MAG TPA: DYNEIN LIGHT CHAIN 2, CYTOPLASMIC TRANSPORT, DIMER INTERFACE.31A [Caudoviricetes sp.]